MRQFIFFYLLLLLTGCSSSSSTSKPTSVDPTSPNIIFILADDLGYNDLSCYGSPRIITPHVDQLATGGLRLTNFYAHPSCSPSRAAFLTGCYSPRVGFPDVVGPPGPNWTKDKQYGLDTSETTIAEILKAQGYATALIGKWHLGHFPLSMPNNHGFDYFYGLPYSNDMLPEGGYPDLTLLRNADTLDRNPDQTQLVSNYTKEAINFIQNRQSQPFFLYLAHSLPHVPLFASEEFVGRSGQGLYADVVEEIDASVGSIRATLEQLGLLENTIIVFTSDNGPWLTYGDHAGSAGPFREGKGTNYEGGVRVPAIIHWPAAIEGGRLDHTPAALIDMLPTLTTLTKGKLPTKEIDGQDLSTLLLEGKSLATRPYYYYRSGKVEAVRLGDWKLHIPHVFRYVDNIGFNGERGNYAYQQTALELYNLQYDPSERYNLAESNPDIVVQLQTLIMDEQAEMDREKRAPFRPEESEPAS